MAYQCKGISKHECHAVNCAHITVVQFGAQSYPWCPEPLTIINCAADEEGAPLAHELLACPAPGGPAWPPNVLPPPIMDAAGVSCGPT